jgi:hypothetical protein
MVQIVIFVGDPFKNVKIKTQNKEINSMAVFELTHLSEARDK